MIDVFGARNIIVFCEVSEKEIFYSNRHTKSQIIDKIERYLVGHHAAPDEFWRRQVKFGCFSGGVRHIDQYVTKTHATAHAAQYIGSMSVNADRDPPYARHCGKLLGRQEAREVGDDLELYAGCYQLIHSMMPARNHRGLAMGVHLYEPDFPGFQNPDHVIEEFGLHIVADIRGLTDGAIYTAKIATRRNLD